MMVRRAWVLIMLILVSTGITVAAQEYQDTTPPVIRISLPMSAQAISGGGAVDDDCQVTVFFEATITDNCCIETAGVTVEVIETTGNAMLSDLAITKTQSFYPPEGEQVHVVGSVLVSALTACLATVQVTIDVVDCFGNEATATWTRDVTDDTPLSITCPGNIEVPIEPGQRWAAVDPGTATATDNCCSKPVAGVRNDGKALSDPYPLGTTTITWTAIDCCGNEVTCNQIVTVKTRRQPVRGSGCYNYVPIPDAGPDFVAQVGQRVVVDGSMSYDPDEGWPDEPENATFGMTVTPKYAHQDRGDLTFEWAFRVLYYSAGNPVLEIPSGSRAVGTSEGFNTEFASFIPDLPGVYGLTLTITDDYGQASTDAVAITVIERTYTAKDLLVGDISGDGMLDLLDVWLCMRIATGDLAGTDAQLECADVDGDRDVDIADVEALSEYILGIRRLLPLEKETL